MARGVDGLDASRGCQIEWKKAEGTCNHQTPSAPPLANNSKHQKKQTRRPPVRTFRHLPKNHPCPHHIVQSSKHPNNQKSLSYPA